MIMEAYESIDLDFIEKQPTRNVYDDIDMNLGNTQAINTNYDINHNTNFRADDVNMEDCTTEEKTFDNPYVVALINKEKEAMNKGMSKESNHITENNKISFEKIYNNIMNLHTDNKIKMKYIKNCQKK